MSIVIKVIGNKKYAYLAFRRGNKVIHKYMGPVSDREVAKNIKKTKEEKQVPKRFHAFFWDTNPLKIDIRRNATYVIERVLEMGDLDALYWIQRIYPTKQIIETYEVSRKISLKSKNFWKIWFKSTYAQ